MLGENSLMYDIHKCTVVLCKFMYSRSSLIRIPALGAGGGLYLKLISSCAAGVGEIWAYRI